jgi:hypothetical protein
LGSLDLERDRHPCLYWQPAPLQKKLSRPQTGLPFRNELRRNTFASNS